MPPGNGYKLHFVSKKRYFVMKSATISMTWKTVWKGCSGYGVGKVFEAAGSVVVGEWKCHNRACFSLSPPLCLDDCCSQDDSLQGDTASLVSASSASVTDPNSSQTQSEAPTKKPKKKRKVSNFQGKLVIKLDYKSKQSNQYSVFFNMRLYSYKKRTRIKMVLTEHRIVVKS